MTQSQTKQQTNSLARLIAVLVCLLAVLCSQYPHTTHAASGVSITPYLQEVTLDEATVQKSFTTKVTNNTSSVRSFSTSVIDFGTLDDTGGVVFAGQSSSRLIEKYGLAKWLTVDNPEFELAPQASVNIIGTISNREDLAPGGHYGALLITERQLASASEIALGQTISTLVFARKLGGEAPDLKLLSTSHDGGFWRLPSKATLTFQNPGNIHVTPRGTVKVYAGESIQAQGVINEDSNIILPEMSRKLFVPLRSRKSFRLWPMVYTLRVEYRYDGIDRFATKNFRIRYINAPAILVLVIGASLLSLILIRLRKMYRTKNKQKPTHNPKTPPRIDSLR